MDYPESRKRQARNDLPVSAQNELRALSELNECQSKGTPVLVDSFQDKQSANMCVPEGFLLFLLMTYCPGVPVPDFRTRPLTEREDIRQAFRIAYEYVSLFTLENYWRLNLVLIMLLLYLGSACDAMSSILNMAGRIFSGMLRTRSG